MVSNRISQKIHLINMVGFLPQHIEEDLQLANNREKDKGAAVLIELAEELMKEDHAPLTDPLLIASIGNYAGFLTKKNCCLWYVCPATAKINSTKMKKVSLL